MAMSEEIFVVFDSKRDTVMNPSLILSLIGLSFVVGGVVLVGIGWYIHRTTSRLTRPLSRIGKLRPGPRKVRGQVADCGKVLRSPMTNQECVYYRLRVYEQDKKWRVTDMLRGGLIPAAGMINLGFFVYTVNDGFADSMDRANSRAVYSWTNLLDEVVSVLFRIEDDTGFVEVDAHRATVNVKTKSCVTTNTHDPILELSSFTDRLRDEHDIEIVDDRGNFKTLRFVEEVISIGSQVTVLGSVESSKGGALCFDADDESLLVAQGDVAKEGRAARKRAFGLAVGGGSALTVGIACLLGALALYLRALPAR